MLSFFAPGKPQGKARARSVRTANGKISHYTPQKTRTYEGLIRTQALTSMGMERPTRRPVKLMLLINYEIPITWAKWKIQAALEGRIVPTVKPDSDNVTKAVKDALNGVAWHDDCQVVLTEVQKQYSTTPGVLISVSMLAQCEAQIKTKQELTA